MHFDITKLFYFMQRHVDEIHLWDLDNALSISGFLALLFVTFIADLILFPFEFLNAWRF
jgi:hypothetical protein